MKQVIKIGITGGIGSGKSTICAIFQTFGIPIYFADTEAKRLMVEDDILKLKIQQLLGHEAYTPQGTLNKAFISDKIFKNNTLRNEINKLVHPAVGKDFNQWANRQSAPYVIEESAILFEESMASNFDKVIVVVADEDLRIQRVMNRNKTTVEAIKQRIRSQWSDAMKIKNADFIIENNGEYSIILQAISIHKSVLKLS